MREIISLQIGQTGNAIGEKVGELLSTSNESNNDWRLVLAIHLQGACNCLVRRISRSK